MLRPMLFGLLTLIWPLGLLGYAQDQTPWEDRLNDLHLNRLNVGDFSVLFEATLLTTPLGEKNGGRLRVYYGRLVKQGDAVRIDCMRQAVSEVGENTLFSHTLQNTHRHEVMDFRFGKGTIKTFENERNRYQIFERLDPILQSLSPYVAVNSNPIPFNKKWADCSLIDGSFNPINGLYTAFLLEGNRKAGANVTFAKNPEWAPVKVDFYTSLDTRPLTDNPKLDEYKKKWRIYSQTKTEWMKLADEHWVPRELSVSQCADDEDRIEIEIFFTNWVIGKEVDKSLLDAKKFTIENITNMVNFNSWRDMLASAHKK